MKVLFLDIDGVLNTLFSNRKLKNTPNLPFVDIDKLQRLEAIIDATKAKIVLSSDWRLDALKGNQSNTDLDEFLEEMRLWHMSIHDFTPVIFNNASRADEIKSYLALHPEIKKWCAVDDDFSCDELGEHWFQTYYTEGLTDEVMTKIIDFLK